jgi:hypothetical protein
LINTRELVVEDERFTEATHSWLSHGPERKLYKPAERDHMLDSIVQMVPNDALLRFW